jgi:hypothetical protein
MENKQDSQVSTDLAPMVAACTNMASWSETKRENFAETFEQRAAAAKHIYVLTAEQIWSTACNRRFVSTPHAKKTEKARAACGNLSQRYGNDVQKTTGRSYNEMEAIAKERAKLILSELPPIKKAVQIIDPKTAKQMDRRDALITKGKTVRDELVELQEEILLEDQDDAMTMAEFKKMLRDNKARQRKLIGELKDIADEGQTLETSIAKALYKGLPGLSDAVVKVVNDFYQRATALSATTRRVGERVRFGDSEAALELLQGFEKDEVEVSDNIKGEFAAAMETLKVAKKQLRAPKKKAAKKATAKRGAK